MTQVTAELSRASVLEDVLGERERQDSMYGDQTHHSDPWWNIIATEENGEVARCIWEKDDKLMYEEIIQACAVYFAWAEAIHRRGKNETNS